MRPLTLAIAGGILAATAFVSAQSGVKVVATIREIHDAMITPASNALFEGGGKDRKDDGQWQALQHNAVILAESGNLLMMGSRVKDKRGWTRYCQALVDAGSAALKAARDKDSAGLMRAGDQIVLVCESCHEPYRDGGRKMPIK